MSEADLHTEFAAMAARAGIAIPAEREATMFEAFKSLRSLLATLHTPYAYAVEPAFIAPFGTTRQPA